MSGLVVWPFKHFLPFSNEVGELALVRIEPPFLTELGATDNTYLLTV